MNLNNISSSSCKINRCPVLPVNFEGTMQTFKAHIVTASVTAVVSLVFLTRGLRAVDTYESLSEFGWSIANTNLLFKTVALTMG